MDEKRPSPWRPLTEVRAMSYAEREAYVQNILSLGLDSGRRWDALYRLLEDLDNM